MESSEPFYIVGSTYKSLLEHQSQGTENSGPSPVYALALHKASGTWKFAPLSPI